MSEESKTTSENNDPSGANSQSSWQDVGQQFKELGESLASAFRTAWENEENQRRLQEMRTGLESMVKEVGKAIDDSAKSPQGQHFREEAEKTVDKVRTAGEQTVQEVRPQLISALQQLNTELQKLVDRMEKHSPPPAEKDENNDVQI
ncbi:MAG: hypothetical protein IH586_21210 [Anaerolineaceae bacterium]|nr:hypothetical protein [Anaerolineaceae bacterium]